MFLQILLCFSNTILHFHTDSSRSNPGSLDSYMCCTQKNQSFVEYMYVLFITTIKQTEVCSNFNTQLLVR